MIHLYWTTKDSSKTIYIEKGLKCQCRTEEIVNVKGGSKGRIERYRRTKSEKHRRSSPVKRVCGLDSTDVTKRKEIPFRTGVLLGVNRFTYRFL